MSKFVIQEDRKVCYLYDTLDGETKAEHKRKIGKQLKKALKDADMAFNITTVIFEHYIRENPDIEAIDSSKLPYGISWEGKSVTLKTSLLPQELCSRLYRFLEHMSQNLHS